jgi:hypothetical protein
VPATALAAATAALAAAADTALVLCLPHGLQAAEQQGHLFWLVGLDLPEKERTALHCKLHTVSQALLLKVLLPVALFDLPRSKTHEA